MAQKIPRMSKICQENYHQVHFYCRCCRTYDFKYNFLCQSRFFFQFNQYSWISDGLGAGSKGNKNIHFILKLINEKGKKMVYIIFRLITQFLRVRARKNQISNIFKCFWKTVESQKRFAQLKGNYNSN